MTSYWKRSQPDPIRGLTLQRLQQQMDAFAHGYVADFALTADAMENRDDILKNVIIKRKKAVTRHGWEVLAEDDSPEARDQRNALDFFYRNLTCSHALRQDERGGFQLLAHGMLDAIAKGYAVHEIAWKPVVRTPKRSRKKRTSDRRDFLTAHFQFVPLWYFEAQTGRLRFLRTPGALSGEELPHRQWLVTVGDALMVPCARAFLFKHQPLQAWLEYTERFGFPGVRGVTAAARGTPEFADMESSLSTFMEQLAVVTNSSESIDVLDLKGNSSPPFADLIERMDRVMAALWRGADLSTLSRDRGYGASLQEQEAKLLEHDDARVLSEHLNATVDRWVIDLLFGEEEEKLARVKVLVTPQECTSQDLAIDQFLVQHGAPLSILETMERYGRVAAKPGEAFLKAKGEISGANPMPAATNAGDPYANGSVRPQDERAPLPGAPLQNGNSQREESY